MLMMKCINCGEFYGAKENTDDHERIPTIKGISSGLCETCWKLRDDSRWYGRHGLPLVADFLKAVLKAREK